MRVAVTGATGLIGSRLLGALTARGDEVTVLSRDPARATNALGVPAERWDLLAAPASAAALAGRDGVIHLAGAPVAQRWSAQAREQIRSSRVVGTANLVAGLEAADPRPRVLVSASASGIYGDRGDEELDEQASPGDDFLAQVCVGWEASAHRASELGVRVTKVRTGIVLDAHGGALAKMLPAFRLGVGGPVAGGRQYMSWIHVDDVVGLYLAALDGDDWSGPVNGCAPGAVTNAEFSHALGRALHRPAVLPVPGLALRAMYGAMAEIVTGGQRMVPRRPQALGYRWAHTDLDEALR
ncbi:MAG TPA: TIGR01777 family oxidoreductase, partial [Solirubrobacteraceae bacterium]|nr:TIGR01777 family oxidoreductase [Solirubrobacteraceae bacterium]